jgi:hypothetical protein
VSVWLHRATGARNDRVSRDLQHCAAQLWAVVAEILLCLAGWLSSACSLLLVKMSYQEWHVGALRQALHRRTDWLAGKNHAYHPGNVLCMCVLGGATSCSCMQERTAPHFCHCRIRPVLSQAHKGAGASAGAH